MEERHLNQTQLAAHVRLGQPQVSRILRGDFARVTKKVRRVCDFLGIETEVRPRNSRLAEVVSGLWDGTKAGEEAICDLLRSVSKLCEVSIRKKD
jgi:hypothetical protein